MAITLNGTSGITSPTYGGTVTGEYSVPVTAFKNRIINGAMMIDQRNAGASVTVPGGTQTFGVDRWFGFGSQASKFTMQQNAGSVTPPVGFTNYLGCTSSAATTVGSAEQYAVVQVIEGFNVADLGWGTANAQSITLSFWVRSSLTGTFGGSLRNGALNRSYPFSYTINSANTWEQKSVTIAGDTTGTWLTNNAAGIYLSYSLGVGSTVSGTAGSWSANNFVSSTGATSVVGTNGATFYLTGVQLEKGSTATSFDYRPYGTELALCQRYYYRIYPGTSTPFGLAYATTTTSATCLTDFPVTMRTAPTALEQSGITGDYVVRLVNTPQAVTAVPVFNQTSVKSSLTDWATTGLTAGTAGFCRAQGTTGYLGWSAEL